MRRGAGPEGLRNAGNKARQTYKEHGIKRKKGKKTQLKMDFFFISISTSPLMVRPKEGKWILTRSSPLNRTKQSFLYTTSNLSPNSQYNLWRLEQRTNKELDNLIFEFSSSLYQQSATITNKVVTFMAIEKHRLERSPSF